MTRTDASLATTAVAVVARQYGSVVDPLSVDVTGTAGIVTY